MNLIGMQSEKKKVKRILFIANHRLNRSPGQRFRFEQYLPFFEANGYECKLSYLISEKDDQILYSEGFFLRKTIIFFKTYLYRFKDLLSIKKYDYVFIFREALLTGSVFFEKRIKKAGVKIIFDFDDAIWLLDTSSSNKKLEWLKNPQKTIVNIKLADAVIAGNNYLSTFAKQYNSNVSIIPTTIDTNYHTPIEGKNNKTICIGWTGSKTTVKHFELAIPMLKKIREKYGKTIRFKLIGDESYYNKSLNLSGTKWNIKTEIADLQEIDIGIMPLPDNQWAKGKCGFKGLQYMALEIPTIMSPIEVNTEIIKEGINGFLAKSEEEWIQKISMLIESEELRKKIGKEGRKTVIEKYSVSANKHKYLEAFINL